jgi:hypothetical protein
VDVVTSSGLCAECIHRKNIRNDRGSIFTMCLRSLREPEYPKYPRLPVLQCKGFESAQATRSESVVRG